MKLHQSLKEMKNLLSKTLKIVEKQEKSLDVLDWIWSRSWAVLWVRTGEIYGSVWIL